MSNCQKCKVFYWKHDEGWDVFYESDGHKSKNTWIPDWFDCALIEDAPSKNAAQKEASKFIYDTHLLGVCIK